MTADQLLSQAVGAARRGDFAEAERLCRSLLDTWPRYFNGWLVLADILVRSRRMAEALAAYETASKIDPGYGGPFTRAAIIRFQDGVRPAAEHTISKRGGPRPRPDDLARVLRPVRQSVAPICLRPSSCGRTQSDCRVSGLDQDETCSISNIRSRARRFPRVDEKDLDVSDALSHTGRTLAGHDVAGFFCGTTAAWGDRAAQFRALLRAGWEIRPLLDRAWHALNVRGRLWLPSISAVAISATGSTGLLPPKWYLAWLSAIWPGLDTPLPTSRQTMRRCFRPSRNSPRGMQKFGRPHPGRRLHGRSPCRNADKVAISNSTFSFTAAMLNERALTFVRPHPDSRELVPFEPWASPVLLQPVIEPGETALADRAI